MEVMELFVSWGFSAPGKSFRGRASFSKKYGQAWSLLIGLEGHDPFYTLKRFAFWVPKKINHCILDK